MTDPFYPVAETPLYATINGYRKPVEGKKVIYNTDNYNPVSVVGEGYRLIPFEDVNNRIEAALGNAGVMYDPKHELSNGGRKIFSTYRLLDEEFRFSPRNNSDDVSQAQIVTYNSYDSSTSFMAAWGMYRMVCSNGCVFGSSEFSEKAYHTRQANYVGMINNMIQNLDSFQTVKRFYNALAEYDVLQPEGEKLIEELVPDNRVKSVIERDLKLAEALGRAKTTQEEADALDRFPQGRLPQPYGEGLGIRRVESVKSHWNKPRHLLPDAEKPRNLWTLYNCFTNVITHEVESANTRNNLHTKVTNQFKRLVNV